MTRRDDLARLDRLGQLILDLRLATLQTAARARQDSLDRLEGLARVPQAEDLPAVAAEQAALRYQRWAEARRGEINLTLARQTAEMLEAREAARQAFGRAQALHALRDGKR